MDYKLLEETMDYITKNRKFINETIERIVEALEVLPDGYNGDLLMFQLNESINYANKAQGFNSLLDANIRRMAIDYEIQQYYGDTEPSSKRDEPNERE